MNRFPCYRRLRALMGPSDGLLQDPSHGTRPPWLSSGLQQDPSHGVSTGMSTGVSVPPGLLLALRLLLVLPPCLSLPLATALAQVHVLFNEGAIVRMDTTRREIYLVFTGHEFAEGGSVIRETLRAHGAKGSFFFTGDFYRNPRFADLIRGLRDDGHYLGPHSNRHLLYAPWERRDSLLVTRKEFKDDLLGNYAAMQMFGIGLDDAPYFLPPYEWYNHTIATWTAEMHAILVDFSPGTSSNADYTTPDMGTRYVSSDSISSRILSFERTSTSGLNGFLLLTHVGAGPGRSDKFYLHLDSVLTILSQRGYRFNCLSGNRLR
jgi:peptidoglycan/xylan/chitin deacetylase (PgdA/CDA1 family)